jgi:hypothetical protein
MQKSQKFKHSRLWLSDWQFFYYWTAKNWTELKLQETLDYRKSDNGLNLPHCWITAHHLNESIISINPRLNFIFAETFFSARHPIKKDSLPVM